MRHRVLGRSFYERDTRIVAFELIGKILMLNREGAELRGKVVETEAYLGSEDPASHAFRGPTPRAKVMFGAAGVSYVYFTYGFHYCLNVVTERPGKAGAVLIRALEPLSGIEEMKRRRQVADLHGLTNGPGKLTQAFGITTADSGQDATFGGFCMEEGSGADFLDIQVSERVGIKEGRHFPHRFFLKDSPFVSKAPRKRPSQG